MCRSFLKQTFSSVVCRYRPRSFGSIRRTGFIESNNELCGCLFSTCTGGDRASLEEAMNTLKMKLGTAGGNEVVRYSELLHACESMGFAKSIEEAKEFAKAFDDAGVIFIFRDKVYLHPRKVFIS